MPLQLDQKKEHIEMALRWPNTVQFSRTLLLMQFSACTRIARNKHAINRAIIFIYSTPVVSVLFFSIFERSVLMVLVFYYKDTLEKVTMQRTQQFSAFSLLPKEPSYMQRMRSCSKN